MPPVEVSTNNANIGKLLKKNGKFSPGYQRNVAHQDTVG